MIFIFGELDAQMVEGLRKEALRIESLMRRWKSWVVQNEKERWIRTLIEDGWFDAVDEVVKAKYRIDYQVKRRSAALDKIAEAVVSGESAEEFQNVAREANERIVLEALKIKSVVEKYRVEYGEEIDVPKKKSPGRPPKPKVFENESDWFGKFDGEDEVYRERE